MTDAGRCNCNVSNAICAWFMNKMHHDGFLLFSFEANITLACFHFILIRASNSGLRIPGLTHRYKSFSFLDLGLVGFSIFLHNNNNWILLGHICPMASRHSTGFTYSLTRNSCLNTSMRWEFAICSRGVEFPRASAWRCLTFPHGVYRAHWLSSRSFPLRPDVRDSPTAPGWRLKLLIPAALS